MDAIAERSRAVGVDREEAFAIARVFRTAREALWAFLLPIIILGGIFGGVVTATEGAALAVVAALNSVVSLYYYMRIVRAMFLQETKDGSAIPVPAVSGAMLVLLAAPTLLLGVYWEPVARIAADSVRMMVF